jgi:hypothetical protein
MLCIDNTVTRRLSLAVRGLLIRLVYPVAAIRVRGWLIRLGYPGAAISGEGVVYPPKQPPYR